MNRAAVEPGVGTEPRLVCGVAERLCAIPLEHVIETMRVLPITPMPGAPPFVRGVSVIRGVPVPVLDLASIVGARESHPTRFVVVRCAGRPVALAVDAVLDVRALPRESLQELPPILRDGCAEHVALLGTLDAQLLLVLRTARLVPDEVWSVLSEIGVVR